MRRLAPLALFPLLAACGGAAAVRLPPAPPTTTAAPPRAVQVAPPHLVRCAPGFRRLGSTRVGYAASAPSGAAVFRRPGGALLARFGPANANDYPTVFSVRGKVVGADCATRWLKVQLPLRPNGATGWVRSAAVILRPVRTRIVVDVSARRLSLYRRGRLVLTTAVAVGSPATPTPTGSFYVNQRLVPTEPDGPYGPGALGISAFSPVLTGWAQGGPVAIHGTNEPWSIGRAVSNGCIRVANDVLRRIWPLAVAGTPVLVRA